MLTLAENGTITCGLFSSVGFLLFDRTYANFTSPHVVSETTARSLSSLFRTLLTYYAGLNSTLSYVVGETTAFKLLSSLALVLVCTVYSLLFT
jgi:hypothetical protein